MMEAVSVREATQVAEARRRAEAQARSLGFDEGDTGRVAIVATELATNLVKHGGGGELLIDRRETGDWSAVELIAIDKGTGLSDVEACLRDGYSTAGSPGTGLGSITRQASEFGIYTRAGLGTAILARIGPRAAGALTRHGLVVGGVTLPVAGETVCGDAWCFAPSGNEGTLMVADGLGHGPLAAEASNAAVKAFQRGDPTDTVGIVTAIHGALRPTRGAAVAAARVDFVRGKALFCGIGNIAGTLATSAGERRMVSHNGTAGAVARRIQSFEYPISDDTVVVLASDGLATSWTFGTYPGLLAADPSLIAAVLYRDHSRGRDDVTVVVLKRAAA